MQQLPVVNRVDALSLIDFTAGHRRPGQPTDDGARRLHPSIIHYTGALSSEAHKYEFKFISVAKCDKVILQAQHLFTSLYGTDV